MGSLLSESRVWSWKEELLIKTNNVQILWNVIKIPAISIINFSRNRDLLSFITSKIESRIEYERKWSLIKPIFLI